MMYIKHLFLPKTESRKLKTIPRCDLASLQQRLLATPLRHLFIPLSWLYAASVWIRNHLYAFGVFKARALPCYVISVGNISVGGTGKTPAVIAIAEKLQKEGKRVAILSRGYKRDTREKITIVSDGEKVCASLTESGDEAHQMARDLRGIPIIVARQRYRAGLLALKRFDVDVLLLDDGFQHRQLARDVDILTVPATHPFGNAERLLPAGTLREPPTALRRADIIILTHTDTPNITAHAKEAVKRLAPGARVLESIHQPTALYPLGGEKATSGCSVKQKPLPELSLFQPSNLPIFDSDTRLTGRQLLAVCGIGNPDAFVSTLMRYSPQSVELMAFPDHHIYTEADLLQIHTACQATQSELIVTTQKDEQKLVKLAEHIELPIAVLAITLVITEAGEKFTDVLLPLQE